jgi:hypothetical protein
MFGEVFASGGEFASEDVVPFNVPVLIFGTLAGTVTDGDGSPLSGVNIDLNGNSLGQTGDDGSFSFEAPVGLHTVTASLMGYMDDTVTGVEVFENQTTTVDLTLQAYPVVSVSGHVTGWDAPDGLSGATVTLQGYTDHSETTDASGNFNVAGVYGGHTYNFRIQKDGYQSYNEQLDVGDSDIDVGTINLVEFTELCCGPPDNLQATVSQQTDVHLTWNPPVDPAAIELFYDDGTYENHWYVSNPTTSTNQLAVGFTYPEDCILNIGKFEMSYDPHATDFDWNVLGGDASGPDANTVMASGTTNLTGESGQENGAWYFIDFGGIEIETDQWFYLSVQYRDGQVPGSDVYYCGGDATADDPYSWYTVDGVSWSNLQGVTDLMIRALISTEFASSVILDPTMPSIPNPNATIMRADATPDLDEHILAKISSIPTANPQITSPISRDLLGYNVYRDNWMIDFVVPTEAWDNDLEDGTYTYFVTSQYDGGESEPSNSVTVTLEHTDVGLVIIDLDPTPTGGIIRDALQDLYPGGVMVSTSLDEYDLIGMDAVFVLLGMYPNNDVIDSSNAQPLLDYMGSGGNLYMEGGDMWYYDPQFQGAYDFGPAFGISAIADGTGDLSQVVGQGFLEGFEWSYSGENNWIDQIDPANDDAFTVFRNDEIGYNCGVAHDPGSYRTVGSSFEIAGLGDNSSLEDALEGIIDFFEIGSVYTETIEVPYIEGWNIVGLPVSIDNTYYQSLFPNAEGGTLYTFDGIYQETDSLQLGEGYLLRMTQDDTIPFIGIPITELTINLSAGWNLFSGLSTSISSDVVYSNDIVYGGTIYGLGGIYYSAETIDPGMGYWIRATQDGEITLTSGGSARQISFVNRLEEANSITFSSGVYTTELYFGAEIPVEEFLSYSLPPKFPQMAFDARFSGDTKVVLESGEIEVLNQSETLIIEYNIKINAGEKMVWVLTLENGEKIILEDSGEFTVPSSEIFVLNREPFIPITFALHQNFPNPFNPVTTLSYDLPKESDVRLTIYDMLGKEITQLVNTTQIPGFKLVQWDATDSMGRPVSAGVYLYQVQAGEFVQTKKMVLLK